MEKSKTLCVALALLSMLLLSVTASSASAQGPIYRAGDWIKYRLSVKGSFMGQTIDCVVSVRINIDSVEEDSVTYTVEASIEKGGAECQYFAGPLAGGYRATDNTRNVAPESGQMFIDPSYTGEYEVSMGRASYHKGVLTKFTADAYGLSMVLELVDTSIWELKFQAMLPWIVLLIVVPIVVVVVVVVVVILLRRRARAEGAVPAQPQPSLPQTGTGAPAGPQPP